MLMFMLCYARVGKYVWGRARACVCVCVCACAFACAYVCALYTSTRHEWCDARTHDGRRRKGNDMMRKAAEKEIEILERLNKADKKNVKNVIRLLGAFPFTCMPLFVIAQSGLYGGLETESPRLECMA